MEQGDQGPEQQSAPHNPSDNVAGPSSRRRRRRRPATNDDIMDAIEHQAQRLDAMHAQNNEVMQLMRQMQQQQQERNAITDQRFTDLLNRFDDLAVRERSPGPRTRGRRQN
jgi:predicted membrane chloride channel (bestrophin family)